MTIRALATLALAFGLAGCQATYVNQLPEGATSACQAEWRGAWIGVEDDAADSDTGVLVDADCRVTVIPGDPGPNDREASLVPSFVPDAGIVLFARSEVAKLLEDDDPAGVLGAGEAWLPYRWSRTESGTLVLEAPDHRRIATLIVNGAFDGVTHWSGDSGVNLIRGEPADIRARLVHDGLFDDDDPIRLRRVGDDRRDVMRALKKAVRAKGSGR